MVTLGEPPEAALGNEYLKQNIAKHFYITPWVFIVPVGVLVMVVMKVDAIVALFVGAVAGAVLAMCIQPEVVRVVSGYDEVESVERDANGIEVETNYKTQYAVAAYAAFINSMALETAAFKSDDVNLLKARANELQPKFEDSDGMPLGEIIGTDAEKDEYDNVKAELAAASLLTGKGMMGMLNTIWLIITAMCFGGLMEACGLLQRLTQPLVEFAKSTGSLVATTAGSCLFVNVTASDQYLAIVVPGRMFRETYKERGLAPENLSRALEDSGTVTSVLIPWNTCGAAQAAVLGVAVIAFAPFCFFNIISPFMTILFAWFGIGVAKLPTEESSVQ